MVLTIWL